MPAEPVKFENLFEGHEQIFESCDCCKFDEPHPPRRLHIHVVEQDTNSAAWRQLNELIDEAADDGREEFAPGVVMDRDDWMQIRTLPPTIAKLTAVKRLQLYGSNLVAVPPEIGEMSSLENFMPYTSRRLHWFPFEITRCSALRKSTVSTRCIYGNFKHRMPFPELLSVVPSGSVPKTCSICNGPFSDAGPIQMWFSLWVARDVLPLLVHACSDDCIGTLHREPADHLVPARCGGVDVPHRGGPELVQPAPYFSGGHRG